MLMKGYVDVMINAEKSAEPQQKGTISVPPISPPLNCCCMQSHKAQQCFLCSGMRGSHPAHR